MFSENEILTTPLTLIDELHCQHGGVGKDFDAKLQEVFKIVTEQENIYKKIPSLNHVPLHQLQNGQLVRFQCMIQDMFDPEFYLDQYVVRNNNTADKRVCTGRFRDVVECEADASILDVDVVNGDRLSYHCISVPAETEWVYECRRHQQQNLVISNKIPSSISQHKRSVDEDEEMQESLAESYEPVEMTEVNNAVISTHHKKVCKESSSSGGSTSGGGVDQINLPLEDPRAQACIVKMYSSTGVEQLMLNDVVEVIGVLSVSPGLANFDADDKTSSILNDENEMIREQAHRLPPSLVPRLHSIHITKMKHLNPLLPQPSSSEMWKSVLSQFANEAAVVRRELHSVLCQILLGDNLAADYVICHLVSHVFLRQDVMPLGKFSLNLIRVPTEDMFTRKLWDVIQLIVTKTFFLPMTLDNMNKKSFIPKKDYTLNCLRSGQLQLSAHTHLVVDETALSAGQLSPDGVKNVTALGNVVNWQKVDYDFQFHQMEYPSDVPVLVLSEGKSILPCDCHVVMNPDERRHQIAEVFEAAQCYLTEPLLEKLRQYVTLVRHLDYSLSEDMQKLVQDDFVQTRQQDSKNFTPEGLHAMLVLARLMSVSYGHSNLTAEVWQQCRKMEEERKSRLSTLPKRSTN